MAVKAVQKLWHEMQALLPYDIWIAAGKLLKGRNADVTKSWWECDHVETVAAAVKAGKQPDHSPANLRVLCCRCHDKRKSEKSTKPEKAV